MPEFVYTARNASGENVSGTIAAPSKRDSLRALSERSLFVLRVESKAPPRENPFAARRIKTATLATNLTQLADLLNNGVPLLAALEILAEQAPHPRLKKMLGEVHDQIADGAAIDEAFGRHPDVFGELTVSMIRAGTEGAFLEDALKRTSDFLELQEETRARLVGAMIYPTVLMTLGTLMTVGLIVFVVPQFSELFARLEAAGGLPGPTVVLLAMSDLLQRFGLVIAAGLLGLVWGANRFVRSRQGRLFFDRWKLKLPIVGRIVHDAAISRFCRVLGTLLRNGVPLLRALEISSGSAGNVVLAQAIRASGENVSSGDTLAKPLAECGLFPRSVMAMIRIAEESNTLDDVLVKIADALDRDNARRIDMMLRLVEPAILVVIGGMILFVLSAMLLPVFDMGRAL